MKLNEYEMAPTPAERFERDSLARERRLAALDELRTKSKAWDTLRTAASLLVVSLWLAMKWSTLSAQSLVLMMVAAFMVRIPINGLHTRWTVKSLAELDEKYPKTWETR